METTPCRVSSPWVMPIISMVLSLVSFQVSNAETIKWGKTAKGLQVGISFSRSQKDYAIGQRVTFNISVRNMGKKPISFNHMQDLVVDKETGHSVAGLFYEFPPKVLNEQKEEVGIARGEIRLGDVPTKLVTLNPGQSVIVGIASLKVANPAIKMPITEATLLTSPGRYTVTQTFNFQREPGVNEYLTSGTIELRIVAQNSDAR